jgi:hypothetical protein
VTAQPKLPPPCNHWNRDGNCFSNVCEFDTDGHQKRLSLQLGRCHSNRHSVSISTTAMLLCHIGARCGGGGRSRHNCVLC